MAEAGGGLQRSLSVSIAVIAYLYPNTNCL